MQRQPSTLKLRCVAPRGADALQARARRWLRDDRGMTDGIEILFGALFIMVMFLFLCQVVVWWHARNILEQSAAEGARIAAAANASCADADGAAKAITARLGGTWTKGVTVTCTGGATEGEIVRVVVTANTPAFFLPGSLPVSALATAPEERA
jgi:hypothetical protein